MGIEWKNAEGYSDPTTAAALANIEKEEHMARKATSQKQFRPLVYICSRYAGDIENNVLSARRYCRFAVQEGYIPFAAHLLYTQFLDDSDKRERELGIFFGKILMDRCDEVWIFGGEYSAGMRAEYERAVRKGYKIRYFTEDCREITDNGNGGNQDGCI